MSGMQVPVRKATSGAGRVETGGGDMKTKDWKNDGVSVSNGNAGP